MENQTVVVSQSHAKAEPKDVFTHLLAIITLYGSAISFINLMFSYINIWIPDALDQNYSYIIENARSSIRFSLSFLIIMFPVYFFTTRYLNGDYMKNPVKTGLRIRKWLIYFTLFIAALTIIGDLIALVYELTGGAVTGRFISKVGTILFVAGAIFAYYRWDLKRFTEK